MDETKEVRQIPVEDIIPNRFQPRINFDEKALNDLSASIKQHGIIQPLVVRPLGDKFEIIAHNDETCIVNWQMTRTMTKNETKQEIDGIFQISLNEDGKCTYFKQWRFTR